jgi:hypothetical protein
MIIESVVSVCDIIDNELRTVKGLSRMRTIQTGVECLVEEGIDQVLAMAIVSSLGNGRTSADVLAEFDIVGGGESEPAKKTTTTGKAVAKKTTATKQQPAKKTTGKAVAKKTTATKQQQPLVIQRAPDYQGNAIFTIGKLGSFSKGMGETRLRAIVEHASAILAALDSGLEEGEYVELES